MWDAILSGEEWRGEFQNKKKDGEPYWVNVNISPLFNNEGKITHFVAVKEDITERKKLENIQSALRNISDAIVSSKSLDEFFTFIYNELTSILNTRNFYIALYNEQTKMFSTLFMHDSKEEINVDFPACKTLSAFVLNTKKSQFIDKKTLNQLVEKSEIELIGTASEVWIGVPLIEQDKAIGVMVIQNYEGERKLTVEDLKLLEFAGPAISVAIERKKFIENLKIEKEKAQAADRLKTAFLNNISHEVRTPLNGILGFGHMMAESDLSAENKKLYLKILKQSSDRLINTITSFMDSSLLVSGNMTVSKKPISLTYLLATIYESFVNTFNEKGLEFKLRINPNISNLEFFTDVEILRKVFTHLIDNALKFTKEGTVQFGAIQKNKVIEFFVEDTGIGIDTEMQKSVFGHFIQEDARIARGYEGAGLGLSIAEGLVELLGGDIKLKSKKGSGTTVTFSIPLP